MERVLGTPALFATAYGNVGSSIYYALGLTAVYALGLTPLVFVLAGIVFAATAATYAEGTVRFPEAGGSSSFARHAFDELVSFGAAWAQMLVYIVTIATSAFFVPHYLSIIWESLNTNPWDIVGGAIVIVVLVALNIVGVQEAAKLSITLAVVDFATQVLLVLLGFALVFNPEILVDNIHWGAAPTWCNLAIAIPVAMLAYTGVETVSNLAEEAREPERTVPDAYKLVALAVFAIYFTLPLVALSALPVSDDRRRADDAARASAGGGRLRERPDPRRRGEPRNRGRPAHVLQSYVGVLAATILVVATNAGIIGRLADHVLDGDVPPDARGVPAPPSALQDAVPLADPVRRGRADRDPAAGRRQLRRHALRARRNPVVHRRARGACSAPHGRRRPERVPRPPEPPARRSRLAGVRGLRRPCDRRLVPRDRRPEPAHALGRARLDGRSGSSGTRSTGDAGCARSCAETAKAPPAFGAALALEYRRIVVPIVPGRPSDDALDVACRLAAERGARVVALTVLEVPLDLPLDTELPEEERVANAELDEAVAIGETYGVRVVGRLVRGRSASAEIVREAERREAEIIVLGSPRKDLVGRRRGVFGSTVDRVMRNAPCRVMVTAARAGTTA